MSSKLNFKVKTKLTKKQKRAFADKFMDWGNIVFAGSVLHQIVTHHYLGAIGFTGLIIWAITLVIGSILS